MLRRKQRVKRHERLIKYKTHWLTKQKYKIITTTNEKYDENNWDTIFDPENKEKIVREKKPLSGKCLI